MVNEKNVSLTTISVKKLCNEDVINLLNPNTNAKQSRFKNLAISALKMEKIDKIIFYLKKL